MAEKASPDSAIVRSKFECAVCHKRIKYPKMLQCLHNFCEKCLENKITFAPFETVGSITCPLCSQATTMHNKGVQNLKTNFHVIRQLEDSLVKEELLSLEFSQPTCDSCDLEKEAVSRCLDCSMYLCLSCKTVHRRIPVLSKHIIASLDELRLGEVTKTFRRHKKAEECPSKHRDFCETCDDMICSEIDPRSGQKIAPGRRGAYPRHKIMKIKSAASTKRKVTKKMISDLQTALVDCTFTLNSIETDKAKLEGHSRELEQQIKAAIRQIAQEIADEGTRLLKEIAAIRQEQEKILQESEKNLKAAMLHMRDSLEMAVDVTDNSSDEDFLGLVSLIHNNLKDLMSKSPDRIYTGLPQWLLIRENSRSIGYLKKATDSSYGTKFTLKPSQPTSTGLSQSNVSPVTPDVTASSSSQSPFAGFNFGQIKPAESKPVFGGFSSSPSKTPSFGTIPQQVSVSKKQEDDDVIFISEKVPTADQRARAERLLLPPTFFLYEDDPPCPGCRGCDDEAEDLAQQGIHLYKLPHPTVAGKSAVVTPAAVFGSAASGQKTFGSVAVDSPSTFEAKDPGQKVPSVFGNSDPSLSFASLSSDKQGTFAGKVFVFGSSSLLSQTPKSSASPAFTKPGEEKSSGFSFASLFSFRMDVSKTLKEGPQKSPVKPKSPGVVKSPHQPQSPGLNKSGDDYYKDDDGDHILFDPIVELPECIEARTGEEGEEVKFSHRAKLFRYSKEPTHQWKERGIGDIKVLYNPESKKYRIVMRREQVLKVCANHFVTPELKLQPNAGSAKSWVWMAMDASEDEVQMEQLAVRFKMEELAQQFKEAVEAAQEDMKTGRVGDEDEDKKEDKKETEEAQEESEDVQGDVEEEDDGEADEGDDEAAEEDDEETADEKDYEDVDDDDDDDEDDNGNDDEEEGGNDDEQAEDEQDAKTQGDHDYPTVISCDPSISQPFSELLPNANADDDDNGDGNEEEEGGNNDEQGEDEQDAKTQGDDDYPTVKSCDPSISQAFSEILRNANANHAQKQKEMTLAESSAKDKEAAGSSKDDSISEERDDIHFDPIVQLPEQLEKITDEEDTNQLFCSRAKLYRYDKTSSQWKDRGIGDIKILHNAKTGRYRIVMRRDLVFRVCANHYITKDMALHPNAGSENSLVWQAMDASDGDPQPEQLAVRFKLAGTTHRFKTTFEKCLAELRKVADDNKGTEQVEAAQVDMRTGGVGDEVKIKDEDKREDEKETEEVQKENGVVQGDIQEADEDSGQKAPSIFGNSSPSLSFASLSSSDKQGTFAGKGTKGFTFAQAGAQVFGGGGDDMAGGDEVHGLYYDPIVPLSELVDTKTGEEDEEVMYKQRARLYRYAKELNMWKERGIGEVKLMRHKESGGLRLLMRREQVLKLCANHRITDDIKLESLKSSDRTWVWHALDYSEDEPCHEQFAMKFKTPELALEFKRRFEELQAEKKKEVKAERKDEAVVPEGPRGDQPERDDDRDKKDSKDDVAAEATVPKTEATTEELIAKFQPKPGSWQCDACWLNNEETALICISCTTPKPGSAASSATQQLNTLSKFAGASQQTQSVTSSGSEFTFSSGGSFSFAGMQTSDSTNKPSGFGSFGQHSTFSKTPSDSGRFVGGPIQFGSSSFDTKLMAPKEKLATAPTSQFTFGIGFQKYDLGAAVVTVKSPSSGDTFGAPPKSELAIAASSNSPTQQHTPVKQGQTKEVLSIKERKGFVYEVSSLSSQTSSNSTLPSLSKPSEENSAGSSFADIAKGSLFSFRRDVSKIPKEAPQKSPVKPKSHFFPIFHLPEQLVDTKTGEEEEEVMYKQRVCLYRYAKELNMWKERGIGEVKLMRHKESGGLRLLMRREQVLKLCANHRITEDMKLESLKSSSSDCTWVWHALDYSEDGPCHEQFAMKFKTPQLALEFKRRFEELQAKKKKKVEAERKDEAVVPEGPRRDQPERDNDGDKKDSKDDGAAKATVPKTEATTEELIAKFQPKPGSWQCDACWLNNEETALICISCTTPKPGSAASSATQQLSTLSKLAGASRQTQSGSEFTFSLGGGFSFVGMQTSDSTNKPSGFGSFGQQSTFSKTPLDSGLFVGGPIQFGSSSSDTKLMAPKEKPATTPTSRFTSGSGFQKYDLGAAGDQPKQTVATIASSGTFSASRITPPKSDPAAASKSKTQPLTPVKQDQPKEVPPPKEGTGFVFGASSLLSPTPKSSASPAFTNPSEEKSLGFSFTDNAKTKGSHFFFRMDVSKTPHETPQKISVVELPKCIEARTGEEGEEVKFSHRAKLFRYNKESTQWKERGIGDIKVLYNPENKKYRIVMRREQVLKVCANHFVTPELKVQPNGGSTKSWVWMAMDTSEDKVQMEQLAVRFKTEELAQQFKEAVEEAKEDIKTKGVIDEVKTKDEDEKEDEKETEEVLGDVQEDNNDAIEEGGEQDEDKKDATVQVEAAQVDMKTGGVGDEVKIKDEDKREDEKETEEVQKENGVQGDIQEADEGEADEENNEANEEDDEEAADKGDDGDDNGGDEEEEGENGDEQSEHEQDSTIQGDDDDYPTVKSCDPSISQAFTELLRNANANHGQKQKEMNLAESSPKDEEAAGSRKDDSVSEERDDIHFDPIVQLPEQLEKITGEEDENQLFCSHAKLYRYNKTSSQWKNRGIGDIKILHNAKTGRYRIVMRRDLYFRVCANHYITKDMALYPNPGSGNSLVWQAMDASDGDPQPEQLEVRFKLAGTTYRFKTTFEKCQAELRKVADDNKGTEQSEGQDIGSSSPFLMSKLMQQNKNDNVVAGADQKNEGGESK